MNISVDAIDSRVDDSWRPCTNLKDPCDVEQLYDGVYDNLKLNDLNPIPHNKLSNTATNHISIEDNEFQSGYTPNIEPQRHEPLLINRHNRRSLYKYQKDIRKQISEILEREKDNDKTSTKSESSSHNFAKIARQISETEAKTVFSQSQTGGSDVDGSEKEVYTRCIQEGDNNLMFLCEPKKTLKTCYQQVGNNNVMVNLHMSMISNSCQILDDEGKIFKLDSDGEIWLEIKVRRKDGSKASDTYDRNSLSRLSTATTDSNTCNESFLDEHLNEKCIEELCSNGICSREPEENIDDVNYDAPYTVDIRGVTKMRDPIFGSAKERRLHEAQEHSFSLDESELSPIELDVNPSLNRRQLTSAQRWNDVMCAEECSECHLLLVEEEKDSIFMQLETQGDGPRLQDYNTLEEFTPVKEALRHSRVMDFLQSQTDNVDFDVSVIELEYQNEPFSHFDNVLYINTPLHPSEGDYSCPLQLERKPTLPPKRHMTNSAISVDITNILQQQNISEDTSDKGLSATTIKTHVITSEPKSPNITLPPLPRRSASENSDLSPFTVCDTEPASIVSSSSVPSDIGKPDKSPIRDLPVPPPLRSKSIDDTKPCNMTKTTASFTDDIRDSSIGSETDQNKHLCWYHGSISNKEARSLLRGMPPGYFLVRDSSDATGNHKYTLEFVDGNTVKRLKIISINGKFSLKESDSNFDTIEELIQEAIRVGIELKDDKNDKKWRKIRITPVNKPNADDG